MKPRRTPASAAAGFCIIVQIIVCALVGGNARADVAPLAAQPPLAIPRNVGYFDYMVVDR